jgi:hypothetical protein
VTKFPTGASIALLASDHNQITFNSFEVPVDAGVFTFTYTAEFGDKVRTMEVAFELVYCEYEKIYT